MTPTTADDSPSGRAEDIAREKIMKPLGRYDGCLQMFVQEPRDADLQHLRFLRWLVEHRGLEQGVAGRPSGPCCGPEPEDRNGRRPAGRARSTEIVTFG